MNDELKLKIFQIWNHVPHVCLWWKEMTLLDLCVEKHSPEAEKRLFNSPDSEVGFLMIQAGKKNLPHIIHFVKKHEQ